MPLKKQLILVKSDLLPVAENIFEINVKEKLILTLYNYNV